MSDYKLGDIIGKAGAFGLTYICWKLSDINQENPYAVKQIPKAKFYKFNKKERQIIMKHLKNEIDLQQQLEPHDNIVKLYDVYEDYNYIYLVMEYLSGGELYDQIVEQESITEAIASKYMKQILSGVQHMQKFDICHLDLKVNL